MMENRCNGGGGGWWVLGRREGKGDAVAFDRDPKLNSEEGETEREGRTGEETNIICRQKNKHYRNIQRYIQLSITEMHTNPRQYETVKLRTCLHTLSNVLMIVDLCDL